MPEQEVAVIVFTPPVRLEHRGKHRLFGRLRFRQGMTLLKEAGLYRQVEVATAEEIAAADIAYLGGHRYLISADEANDLIEAGYGDFIDFGDGPRAYGSGPYGAGPYGGAA